MWQGWIFWEFFFFFLPQKSGKMGQKPGFLNLLKNLVISFYWICSIMKTYYLLCSCTNPVFGKIFVPGVWAKMFSANQIARFLNQPFLQNKSLFSRTKWSKIFWFCMVKNGCDQSGLWALKLIVSQEWTDGINWFFACWYSFTEIKRWLKIFGASMVKNRFDQSDDGTLKFTVS